MAIKVQIPAGVSTVTVNGLYQWDYGQVLEIESIEIGSEILEVHFACLGMTEAVVRACTFSNGVGTVTIPDECLEQTGAITAWVYEVNESQGHTIKVIVLPVTARTRPSKNRDIPEEYVDAYGQLIEEVNETIDALEKGNIAAARALNADNAKHAATASSAQSATYATSAGNATNAGIANVANGALALSPPSEPFATVRLTNGEGTAPDLKENTLYLVVHYYQGMYKSGVYLNMGGIQYANIGDSLMTIYDGTITFGSTTNGTLNFYTLGGLS